MCFNWFCCHDCLAGNRVDCVDMEAPVSALNVHVHQDRHLPRAAARMGSCLYVIRGVCECFAVECVANQATVKSTPALVS